MLDIVYYSTKEHIDIIIPYITSAADANFLCLLLPLLLDLIWGPGKLYSEATFLENIFVVPI